MMPSVLEATTAKTVFDVDRETLQRTPSDPKALAAILDLLTQAKANKVDAKDLQEWLDSSLKAGELYGPRYQLKHQLQLLEALQGQKAYASVAVETARKIGKQVDAKLPMDTQLQLLTAIAGVLHMGNAKDEAKTLETRIDKMEGKAYTDYSKDAAPTSKRRSSRGAKSRAIARSSSSCSPAPSARLASPPTWRLTGSRNLMGRMMWSSCNTICPFQAPSR